MPRNVRLFPPGQAAPQRPGFQRPNRGAVRGRPLGDLPHAGPYYGQDDRNTNPPGFYRDFPPFNEGAVANASLTPMRKMAQYAFSGSANPTLALPANYLRCYLIIQNRSAATNLFVGFGAGATASTGILILPGGGNFLADYSPPTDDVYIFFAAGAAEVCVICEGVYQLAAS